MRGLADCVRLVCLPDDTSYFEEQRWVKEEKEAEEKQEREAKEQNDVQTSAPAAEAAPDYLLVVARLSPEEVKNTTLKDILGPLKAVINTALPLVEVPALHQVRERLLFESPHALEVIDFALADLVGRATVRLSPLLLVGDPGGGKTRFARRLGEALGVSVWREDVSRADGAVFGGTDRRRSILDAFSPPSFDRHGVLEYRCAQSPRVTLSEPRS